MFKCLICNSQINSFIPLPEIYFNEIKRVGSVFNEDSFETINVRQFQCPVCGSSDRCRLYALFMEKFLTQQNHSDTYSVLDLAPSKPLSIFMNNLAKQYFKDFRYRTADLYDPNVDDVCDITNMYIYPDNSFDFLLCSHMLEHVDDDVKALKELHRVLKIGGHGILMVPIALGINKTDEDINLTNIDEKWRRFAANNHVRLYSRNSFMSRLYAAGFSVGALGIDYFGSDSFQQNAITETSILYIVTKQAATLANSNKPPKVSVLIPTYNQSKYIGECLESVLSQSIDSDIEIIIGEDCSNDKTRDIVLEYQLKYPSKIKLFLPEFNIGPAGNFLKLLDMATGEYIAYIEGDDLWINSYKLQIQVAHLDSNPSCAGCFGDSLVVAENGKVNQLTYYIHGQRQQKSYSSDDIIRIIGITPSNALVFRRSILETMPAWFNKLPGHSALELYITLNGTLDYLDFHFGARRLHNSSSWAARSPLYQLRYAMIYKKILLEDSILNNRFGDIIYNHLCNDVSRIFDEIRTGGAENVPDVNIVANVDLTRLANNTLGSTHNPRIDEVAQILADAGDNLMTSGAERSARWLYRLALDMNSNNRSARFGWIWCLKTISA